MDLALEVAEALKVFLLAGVTVFWQEAFVGVGEVDIFIANVAVLEEPAKDSACLRLSELFHVGFAELFIACGFPTFG